MWLFPDWSIAMKYCTWYLKFYVLIAALVLARNSYSYSGEEGRRSQPKYKRYDNAISKGLRIRTINGLWCYVHTELWQFALVIFRRGYLRFLYNIILVLLSTWSTNKSGSVVPLTDPVRLYGSCCRVRTFSKVNRYDWPCAAVANTLNTEMVRTQIVIKYQPKYLNSNKNNNNNIINGERSW